MRGIRAFSAAQDKEHVSGGERATRAECAHKNENPFWDFFVFVLNQHFWILSDFFAIIQILRGDYKHKKFTLLNNFKK
ncbi:MAG TPA: hypothetical protein DEA43_00835 [Candidatus Moranbacteria bacterium]|nr:hypothetical protein [Candidatus Moranbacteria bacterium]HBT45415.1 hypothetical protein [Candidatus Moranbacteria bacterium]